MSYVDWRNRFGWNWISSVRDQDGTNRCYAFCITALCEAMVRIAQCVWCRRSEADIGNGVGKQPWDTGNPGEAANFVQNCGAADPDCFPWTTGVPIYAAREGIGALPLSPTPDRAGRTVKMAAPTNISDLAQRKLWIDEVGPMAVIYTPFDDFQGYQGMDPNGNIVVYKPTTPNQTQGSHCMLVVGFNDNGGTGAFYSVDSHGGMNLLREYGDWRKSWDLAVTGTFAPGGLLPPGAQGLLLYDQSADVGAFYSVDSHGGINLLQQYNDWRKSWDLAVTGDFASGGSLLYDRSLYLPTATRPYWIVKNSWGPNRGDGGFGYIAYAESP